MADIKKGDRVKVTIEGEVANTTTHDYVVGIGGHNAVFARNPRDYTVTVEKIEPPVEVFKPGDVVRDKGVPDFLYSIGPSGYTQLSDGSHFKWDSCLGSDHFTSREFEKVNIE